MKNDEVFEHKCPRCGHTKAYYSENSFSRSAICEECAYIDRLWYDPNYVSDPVSIPKCPTCQSTKIHKISSLERGASIAMLGLFSKKINKSFKCDNCGYTW